MVYNYFISYTVDSGNGIVFLERDKKIKSFKDIEAINEDLLKYIDDKNVKKVFVNNFILINRKFGKVVKNIEN